MNADIHVLAWSNIDKRMISAQRSVLDRFGIDATYCREKVPHGIWLDTVLRQSSADVVGFLDVDCVPTNQAVVQYAISYCQRYRSFIGIAQSSNHLGLRSHIFAAPAFLFIWRKVWDELGQPGFSATDNADVAEHFCYTAEAHGKRYGALYPTHWDREPEEGVWRLHNYGLFGIGTHFERGVYHLYQGRSKTHVNLFVQRCREIVEGRFSTEGMKSSRDEYEGRIVP